MVVVVVGGGVVEEVFMCGDVNSLSVIGVCLFLFPFFFRRLFFSLNPRAIIKP